VLIWLAASSCTLVTLRLNILTIFIVMYQLTSVSMTGYRWISWICRGWSRQRRRTRLR